MVRYLKTGHFDLFGRIESERMVELKRKYDASPDKIFFIYCYSSELWLEYFMKSLINQFRTEYVEGINFVEREIIPWDFRADKVEEPEGGEEGEEEGEEAGVDNEKGVEGGDEKGEGGEEEDINGQDLMVSQIKEILDDFSQSKQDYIAEFNENLTAVNVNLDFECIAFNEEIVDIKDLSSETPQTIVKFLTTKQSYKEEDLLPLVSQSGGGYQEIKDLLKDFYDEPDLEFFIDAYNRRKQKNKKYVYEEVDQILSQQIDDEEKNSIKKVIKA